MFFLRQLYGGEIFYCCDNLLINIPAKMFWVKNILSGTIPFWNPYLFSGTPFLSDINLSTFSPGNILYFFLDPFQALTISMLAHLFIAGIGTYWMSKQLGFQRVEATLVSIIFTFSGTMITYLGNAPMIQVVAFFPLIFGFWVRYIRTSSKGSLTGVVVMSVLQFFSGHVQLTFYTYLFVSLYALVFLKGSLFRKIWQIGGITFLFAMISGVQLFPFLEFAIRTTRIGKGFTYASFGALPITAIVRFIFPTVTGTIVSGTDWWQGGSVYGYVGLIPMLLALSSLYKAKKRELFFGIVGVVAFIAAFGSVTPVFRVLYTLIPGLGLFRVPSHLLLISTFCLALLAGGGYEHLRQTVSAVNLKRLGHVLFFASLSSFILWMVLRFGGIQVLLDYFMRINNEKIHAKISTYGMDVVKIILNNLSWNVLLISIELFILDIVLRFKKKNALIILAAMVFIDLFLLARTNLLSVPISTMNAWRHEQQDTAATLLTYITPGYRVYVHPSLYSSIYKRSAGVNSFELETKWQLQSFRPNLLNNYDIQLVDGYASMIDQQNQDFFGVKAEDPTGITIPDSALNLLKQIGVRYILLRDSKNVENTLLSSSLRPVWSNGTIALYELPEAKPIVGYEDDGTKALQYQWINDHTIEIAFSDEKERNISINQMNYPGWNATMDGKPIPIQSVHSVLQQLSIPSGDHSIILTFVPRFWKIGILVTILGLVVLFVIPKRLLTNVS